MPDDSRRREDALSTAGHLDQVVGQAAANEAVRVAEQALCDAWLAELIDAEQAAADTMTRSRVAADAARTTLWTELVAGDVRRIATAHAVLEGCIRDLEEGIAGYEKVHALLADQCAWSAEAAALRDYEAAADEDRIAAAMRR